MHKFLVAYLVFAAIKQNECMAVDSDPKQTYYITNPRAIDYKFVGKKDEHRFGVELKENKQFHHTKTAEDGVRLGCYGYELEGKKYSTQYVADAKGYRLVPDQGLITVYPKDGSEARKASFVKSFNEDEIASANIRYFFPDGCQSPKLEFDPAENSNFEKMFPATTPKVKITADSLATITTTIPSDDIAIVTATPDPDILPMRYGIDILPKIQDEEIKPFVAPISTQKRITFKNEPSDRFYLTPLNEELKKKENLELEQPTKDEVTKSRSRFIVTENSKSSTEKNFVTEKPNLDKIIVDSLTTCRPNEEKDNRIELSKNVFNVKSITTPFKAADTKCSDTCCDDNRPSILMSRAAAGSCCKGVSKIVIPIETSVLELIPLPEISEITKETRNIQMLKMLLALAEKYNL